MFFDLALIPNVPAIILALRALALFVAISRTGTFNGLIYVEMPASFNRINLEK